MARTSRGGRGRSGRGARWIPTLLGLALLAIPGFALGLVAGLLWEEPQLVASYALGGTQEIAWGAEPKGDRLPDVAAGPPQVKVRPIPLPGPQRVAADPPASSRPVAAAPARLSAPPPAGRFAVQVGAFAESRSAEGLADSLRAKGYAVYVSPGSVDGDARWRVRVGPMGSRERAEHAAAKLKTAEKLPTWVLDDGRR